MVTTTMLLAQPANDDICDATVLTPDGSCVTGTSIDATPDLDDPGCTDLSGSSVWFTVTITDGNDTLHLDLSNISIPGMELVSVNVFTFLPDCMGTPTQIPGGDYCGGISSANFTFNDVIPGTTYYIQVITPGFEEGEFEICATEAGPLVCLEDSTCEDAVEIDFGIPPIFDVCITGCLDNAPPGPMSPDSCFDMPNETVWYTVYLPPVIPGNPPGNLPTQATISVTTSSPDPFPPNPQLAVFQNCDDLNQVACDYGEFSHSTGGPGSPQMIFATASVTFSVQDYPDEFFLIAVSYAPGEKIPDDFELCVSLGTLCNPDSEVEVKSTSLGSPLNGPYSPGEVVEICLQVNDWNSGQNSSNCNFMHGLVPQFGDCWDPSSFDDEGQPIDITVPMTNNSGAGNWVWFDEGLVSYNFWANPGYLPPNSIVGAGWFYIRNEGEVAQCTNYNNPNCTRGDGFFCEDDIQVGWEICFNLKTKPFPDCEVPENTVCDISFRTYGDSETGGYQQVGCTYDQAWDLELTLECCEQPFFDPVVTQFSCSETDLVIDLESNLDPDVEYIWEVSDNDVGATPCESNCPNIIEQTLLNESNDAVTVVYTITPTTISDGCVGEPFPVEVEINPRLSVEIPPRPPVCSGNCTPLFALANGGQPPYSYVWENLGIGMNQTVCPEVTTEYNVTVFDNNGCSATASQTVSASPNLSVSVALNPDTDEICENDPNFPIELTAQVDAGGSGSYIWLWNTSEFSQTIEAPESGSYCITVIDAATFCTGEVCQQIVVNPAPEPAIQDPGILCDATAQYCMSAEPEGGLWLSDTISITEAGCLSPSNIGPGFFEVCYEYTDPETMCDSTTCLEIQILGAPVFDEIPDTTVCDYFQLPVITGTNLSGNAAYFEAPDGAGAMYNPGDSLINSGQYYLFEILGDSICISQDSFVLTVNPSPNADFIARTPICIGDTSIIEYIGNASSFATYSWDFGNPVFISGSGPGPYQVVWDQVGSQDVILVVNDRECFSPQNIETVVIEQVLSPPVVDCSTTTTQIEFSWSDVPGATGYEVNVISGMAGTLNGNTYLVTGLMPTEEVTIEVIALSDGVCGSSGTTVTCAAIDCPNIDIEIDPINDICLTGSTGQINLNAVVNGSNGTGSGSWSGLFTTVDGVFDPAAAGPGQYLIGYTFEELSCTYSNSIQVNVFESPSPLFSLESEICENEIATILYEGNAAIDATYIWDFDGGIITNGTGGVGPGPHEIEWDNGSAKVISLTVEENGCFSDIQLENIDVITELADPIISCESTTEEIIFTWLDVTGSSGFDISLLDGEMGVINGNTYTVSNLDPEESVTIQVEALSVGPCPNSLSLATECITMACSLPDMEIANINDTICLDANTGLIDLDIIFTPNNPTGSGVWSGTGIIDVNEGIFDPSQADIGTHILTFNYNELNCADQISGEINVFEIPDANFTIQDTICLTETANVIFSGSNPAGNFNWGFDNANIISGSNEGPYELQWDSPGQKMISVVLERNSCESQLVSIPIFVEDTLPTININCEENYEDISFTWTSIPGVEAYEIYVNGTLVSTQMTTSYLVDGLNPNEDVDFEVVAINGGRCPSKSFSTACTTSNCPPIDIIINPGDTSFCFTQNSLAINLDSIINGGLGSGMGVGTWDGPGVDPLNGIFDPADAGIGTHVITLFYDELDCLAEASIDIEVLPQPTSDFSISNLICVEDSATINFSGITGTNPNFNWDLQGGNLEMIGPDEYKIWWDNPGEYEISLSVSENGCLSESSFGQIIVEPSLDSPDISCTTTTESIEFTWDDIDCASSYEIYIDTGSGLNFVGIQTNTDFSLLDLDPETDATIEVVAISDCSCPTVSTLDACTASMCPPIELNASQIAPFCWSDRLDPFQIELEILGGNGTGIIEWIGPGVNNQGIFDPDQAGIGTHEIQYAYTELNCRYDGSLIVDIYDDPSAVFTIQEPTCFGDLDGSIEINASGGDNNYEYLVNGSLVSSSLVESLGPGTYDITILDGNNCMYEETINIPQAIEPDLDIEGPFSIFVGNTGELSLNSNIPSNLITNIIWEENGIIICEGCTELAVSPDQSSEYCLTLLYGDGCEVSTCVDLRVEIEKNIYIPNVFSPNDDGINDYFTIYTNNVAQQINFLRVFDRWGEQVFEIRDIPTDMEEMGWDGKFNSENLMPGVYVFVAEIMYSPTDFELVSGDITLIR